MPDQFEVGQRVYWSEFDMPQIGFVTTGWHVVASGVVVTTGPAISTIWADEGSVRPRMVTKANDKVTADREAVVAEIAPKNEKIRTDAKVFYEQMRSVRTAAGAAAEPAPRRRSWGRR
jgi:hypothetical protein